MTVASPVEPALVSILRNNGTLAALLGLSDDGLPAVYHQQIPPGSGDPAIAFEQISGEVDSPMGADSGVESATFQLTIVADPTDSEDATTAVKAVVKATKAALARYRGTVGDVTVMATFIRGQRDLPPGPELVDRRGVALDVQVWYR